MSRRTRLAALAVLIALGLTIGTAPAHAGNDYGDLAYLRHDLDNVARSAVTAPSSSS